MRVKMRRKNDGWEVTTHSDDKRDKRAYCTALCPGKSAEDVKNWLQLELPAVLAETAVVYAEAVGVQRYTGNGVN